MVLPLLVGRVRSVEALAASKDTGGLVLLLTQRNPTTDEPVEADLFGVGTVARVVQTATLPDGTARVVLEGVTRARLIRLDVGGASLMGTLEVVADETNESKASATADLTREVVAAYGRYARLHERVPDELPSVLSAEGDPVRLSYLIAGHVHLPAVEKQEVLETESPGARLERLRELLERELNILQIEAKLDRQLLRKESEESDFGPGLTLIHREPPTDAEEWVELDRTVQAADLPPHAQERAERELARLRRLNPVAPEAAVIRTYVDWITALPWRGRTADNLDVTQAAAVLEREHFGLADVKDRILDHVAVLSLVGDMRGPILCLVGPPGVGKTSLGESIAKALGREFVRVSLGGVRDEAEIRGHRRTYVGAMPGRVLQGMRRSGSTNPVFLLDEVDKMARDFHGDPGAALLEVLDPEQNRTFTDHYLELDYDLSDVLFIATANTLQDVPEPLRDRMEIIRLPGYLDTEKREIAGRFLWPRQARRHGLDPDAVRPTDEAIDHVIRTYTREAGVRELDRRLSRLARKVARAVAEGAPPSRQVPLDELRALLGPPTHHPPERDQALERIGIANALAWTAAGGEVLDVEVAVVPGAGNVRLTGTLGDVMKESAHAAVTYARSRSDVLGLTSQFHEHIDVHIHIPEGATPKDGPSAGITIALALISALTNTPTRADVALTGEITLRGRVLGVGGVKEKAVAALRGGIRTMVLPAANSTDLELLPDEVRSGVDFVLARSMDEVMDAALHARAGRSRTHPSDVGASLPHA